MNPIPLSHDARVQALRQFGYTQREAAFLCLAALQGGYFLRRQYGRFLGKEGGGTVAALIQKAVAYEHVKASTYATNTHVYHLATRPFYAALGQVDNRNRRDRQPLAIKSRLMALDFVLEHPDHRYLATEHEKVEYLTGAMNIDGALLPAKRYPSNDGRTATSRFFVDKYPIFLGRAALGRPDPEVSFCFVDHGATTVSAFETYLHQRLDLFAALPHFRVIYVATRSLLFESAQRAFQRELRRSGYESHRPNSLRLPQRLREYFEARLRYETGLFSTFDRAELIRLRDDREAFPGDKHDALFERWKRDRRDPGPQISVTESAPRTLIHGAFSTCLLEHSYELFGSLTAF